MLQPRRPRQAARPALASAARAGAPARAAARCGRADAARLHHRLLGVHAQCRRERGGGRRLRARGRAARRRVAAVRAPEACSVPADDAAQAQHFRVLHCEAADTLRRRSSAPTSGCALHARTRLRCEPDACFSPRTIRIGSMPWSEWIRTVEIEPALDAVDAPSLERSVEALLRTGCRVS